VLRTECIRNPGIMISANTMSEEHTVFHTRRQLALDMIIIRTRDMLSITTITIMDTTITRDN